MKKFLLAQSIILLLVYSITSYALPPLNIACVKNAVIDYYTHGQYENDVDKLIQDAEKYLFKRINDNTNTRNPVKLAIILDIDDTSLTNFSVNKTDDFSNVESLIEKRYEKANSPAIKPVLRLYNEAIANGVKVFFVTFRPKSVESYTITNLKNEGYTQWAGLYLPSADEIHGPSQIFKTSVRKLLTEQGYNIILNVGDQYSDLDGGYSEYTVKIPNPMYTSALSCNRDSLRTGHLAASCR